MRIDGRKPEEMRSVEISRGYMKHAEGSALITIGDTIVLCSASIEDRVPPFMKDTGYGWVTAEYSMLPRSASSRITRESSRGRVGGRTHEIQRLIGRSLRAVTDMAVLGERTIWIDCDVIQADGGTRTASITGAFFALYDACVYMIDRELIPEIPIRDYLAAVSVGMVNDVLCLDLNYQEDSAAQVDMNVVMTGGGRYVEIQGTAEQKPFSREDLGGFLDLAEVGIGRLIEIEKDLVGEIPSGTVYEAGRGPVE